ncbi:hypothetical protein U9M48_003523 [Paspalum notatum var. saurae]|uniref:Reverse transcriptase Ty1/copia-type domain-containing protein n=1 Tax=Paspalum notatum var. saurae TaxID=547442 RepID=A0AAQ3PIM1_PASNO
MTTRAKLGFGQPALFSAMPLSPIPKTFRSVLADPRWRANVVSGNWVFRNKFKADGSLNRYKACWVLRGFTQRPSIDYDEIFSPAVKPATVWMVLFGIISWWLIHQLDVKNAFLHGTLSEPVYYEQPYGFEDTSRLGLEAKSDTSLFVFHRGTDTVYRLLYVDDIVLTASSHQLLRRTFDALHRKFAMKDLGELHHFLVDTNPKLAAVSEALVDDASAFHSLISALQYLTFTRLDISYAVQQICLHMHDPREPHLAALKCILRYVRGYDVFLGDNLVSWSSKRQNIVSRSSVEAKYRAVANAVAEASWLRQLLQELHSPPRRTTLVYCDNISSISAPSILRLIFTSLGKECPSVTCMYFMFQHRHDKQQLV